MIRQGRKLRQKPMIIKACLERGKNVEEKHELWMLIW